MKINVTKVLYGDAAYRRKVVKVDGLASSCEIVTYSDNETYKDEKLAKRVWGYIVSDMDDLFYCCHELKEAVEGGYVFIGINEDNLEICRLKDVVAISSYNEEDWEPDKEYRGISYCPFCSKKFVIVVTNTVERKRHEKRSAVLNYKWTLEPVAED